MLPRIRFFFAGLGAIGEVDSVRGRFSLLRLETTPNGAIAFLAFDGRALTKPLLLVLDDGAYKVDGGPTPSLSGEDYFVENLSGSSRTVECYVSTSKTFAPYEEGEIYCVDVSAVCNYSGTRFLYNKAYHSCDYNTWGTDFYINPDGSGQCNDRC